MQQTLSHDPLLFGGGEGSKTTSWESLKDSRFGALVAVQHYIWLFTYLMQPLPIFGHESLPPKRSEAFLLFRGMGRILLIDEVRCGGPELRKRSATGRLVRVASHRSLGM